MRHAVLSTAAMIFAIVVMAVVAVAQQPQQIVHYQGMLTGPGGGPLRTDIYDVNFSIWEEEFGGVQSLWSEQQTVEVVDGLFDVYLGIGSELGPDIFTRGVDGESTDQIRYLEIQVEGDEPMSPRIPIAKVPTAFTANRILGDIETAEGSLLLRNNAGDSAIVLISNDVENALRLNRGYPPDPCMPALEMSAYGGEANILLQGIDGESTDSTAIVLNTASRNADLILKSFPTINQFSSEVQIGTNSDGADMRMNICETYTPVIGFHADTSEGSFQITRYSPVEVNDPTLQMIVNEAGGTISLADPRPTPLFPDLSIIGDESGARITTEGTIGTHPFFELHSDFAEVGLSLADLRPTPDFPGLSIVGNEAGLRITTEGTIGEHPFFEIYSDFSVAGLTLEYPYPMQPVPGLSFVADVDGSEILFGITELQQDIISIGADALGGNMRFYGTGRDIIIEMSSSGDIIAQRGNFGIGNINNGIAAFVAGSGNVAEADYSTVGGGQNNHAEGDYSTVAGGQNNTAEGLGSFVGGGYQNTASGGHSVVAGGNFNLNQGNYSAIPGGYADTITTSAYMSYLFGVGSKLTADSTFMVDMPHIRFGDETDGYEFPPTDGANGQVLVTDGHGQLSWDGHRTVVNDKLDRVIEENNELKNLITELERRISELERK